MRTFCLEMEEPTETGQHHNGSDRKVPMRDESDVDQQEPVILNKDPLENPDSNSMGDDSFLSHNLPSIIASNSNRLTATGVHQSCQSPVPSSTDGSVPLPNYSVDPVSVTIKSEPSPEESTDKSSKTRTRLTVDICGGKLNDTTAVLCAAPKSPVTVQDWVDSIDVSQGRVDFESSEGGSCAKGFPLELADNLGLGAEALHLQLRREDEPKTSDVRRPDTLRKAFQLGHENSKSLNSETSEVSTVSISSVEAFLETMRDDPEEILANLGFGSPVSSPLARIPKRFLMPSQVKGNDLHDFIEKHEEMQELFDMGFSGYRGLSGCCMDGHSPSGIVSKILEKIRERNNELKRALTMSSSNTSAIAASRPPTMSFFHAAVSVMAANAFRNGIRPGSSNNSILEPENRQFLDSQDEMMSDRRKRRPRLVLGKCSYTVDTDEELIDDDEDTDKKNSGPPRSTEPLECVVREVHVNEIKVEEEEEETNLYRRPLIHSMSDEVFLPADNKTRLWDVVRNKRKSLSTGRCEIGEDHDCTPASEPVPQIVPDSVNMPESTGENEAIVVVEQYGSRKLNRLTRQMSIHEEVQEKSFPEQQQQWVRTKLESIKCGPNKDSFELEELPVAAGDLQDDDWHGSGTDRKGQHDTTDIPRTGSAMSDSSGFLDGETLETVMDIIDEVSLQQITPVSISMQALQACSSPTPAAPPLEVTEGEALEMSAISLGTGLEGIVETTSTHERTDRADQPEGIDTDIVEDCDGSFVCNCDTIGSTGYLSESDTIVAMESSSSGYNQPTSVKEMAIISVAEQPSTVRKMAYASTAGIRPLCPQWHRPRLDTDNLTKSRSEVNLPNVYTSPFSHHQRRGTSGLWTSLDNVSGCRLGAQTETPQLLPRVGSDGRMHHFWNRNFENSYSSPLQSRDIPRFHESCALAIERMQEVLQLYTKQLKEMERSCWETHNRFFPGMTIEEREELRKLSDLRRYILEEASRTQFLLCNRTGLQRGDDPSLPSSPSQCNPQLVKIANQLDVLISCQRDLNTRFLIYMERHGATPLTSREEQPSQSQVQQMLDRMKREIIQEVRNVLETDHLNFQEELQKTRRGIEEIQETVVRLLSSLQAATTPPQQQQQQQRD